MLWKYLVLEPFFFVTNLVEISLWLENLFLKKLLKACRHKLQHNYTEPVSLDKQVPSCFAETSLELQVLWSQYKPVRTVLILLWNTLDPKCAGRLWSMSTIKMQTECPALRQHSWQSSLTHLKVGSQNKKFLTFTTTFETLWPKIKLIYHDFVHLHMTQSICADRCLEIKKKFL